VLDYFWKKINEVLDALLEPFWLRVSVWINDLSWRGRTLLLVLVGLMALAFLYWNSLPLFYRTAVAFGKIATTAPTQIPLDSSIRANVVRTSFRKKEVAACNCWQEITAPHSLPNVIVSGWVLFALAEFHFPATESELRFFLMEQKRDGWWSVFQATDEEANASTFGTAWALIGLQAQLRNKLIPQTMEEEVSNAIRNGSSWLIRHRSGTCWKDYPLNEAGKDSVSLSGLVMHALHLTAPDSIEQLKKDWLYNLPSAHICRNHFDRVPDANAREQSFFGVKLRVGDSVSEAFVQLTLPWMLIATADAYSAGNHFERTRALLWMERALDQESVIHADTQVNNWWRAEFLLALRYVAG
jgi:hypothetical protein